MVDTCVWALLITIGLLARHHMPTRDLLHLWRGLLLVLFTRIAPRHMKSIFFIFVKHLHKISSAFGRHVIERNFPSQKKEVDILFFETRLFFLFFFPHYITIRYHAQKWFLFLGPLPYAGERPTPKALPYCLKKIWWCKEERMKFSSSIPPTTAIF